jgi:arylsulfatase A-like enzyme
MSKSQKLFHLGASVLALSGCVFACRGKAPGVANDQTARAVAAPATATEATPAKPPAGPELDEAGPSMDLVASRALWHVYGQGLVIPFASEGFRKYSQEYTSPWKATTKVEDKLGRPLGSTAATLRFPWALPTTEATVLVRVHGATCGKRLSLRLNGKPLKNTELGAAWQQVAASVPAGLLVKGENTLAIAAGKKGGVFHSIEIVPGKASAAGDWPAATPATSVTVDGKPRDSLGGFARMMMPLEVPQQGWLVLGTAATAGPAHFQIAVAEDGQPARLLLDEKQDAGATRERRVSLAAFAGKLVALEFAVTEGRPADAAWLAPRILLVKATVAPRPQPAKNLVVLVADALRADRLPMYAETRVQTPNIAKAAQTLGVTFASTQAASPSSPPSHASIQSGCMPRAHGILGDKSKVTPGTPMVSAILAKAGIATDFIGDASFAMRRLLPVSKWTEFHQPNAEGKGGDCSGVVKEILAFADKNKDKRFFISSVAFEAHTPYIYHQGTTEHYYAGPFDDAIGKHPDGVVLTEIVSGRLKMTPERWGQIKGLYDGEVEHLDECFGTLMEGLRTRGLGDNTPVVLLADHGEGFLEHGSMGHAYGQYAELTRVPLVLFAAGLGHGQKIPTVVSHADVVPTIVDLMGVPADERVQGESLLPMVLRNGPWVPRVVPSEYGRSYSLRSLGLHYVVDYGGNESLYDLVADPAEKTELKDKCPLALRYFRDLAGIYLAHRAKWHAASWGTLNNHGPGFVAATGG